MPKFFRPHRTQGNRAHSGRSVRYLRVSGEGEVNSVILSDGTIIRFKREALYRFGGLFQIGQRVAATGYGSENQFGRAPGRRLRLAQRDNLSSLSTQDDAQTRADLSRLDPPLHCRRPGTGRSHGAGARRTCTVTASRELELLRRDIEMRQIQMREMRAKSRGAASTRARSPRGPSSEGWSNLTSLSRSERRPATTKSVSPRPFPIREQDVDPRGVPGFPRTLRVQRPVAGLVSDPKAGSLTDAFQNQARELKFAGDVSRAIGSTVMMRPSQSLACQQPRLRPGQRNITSTADLESGHPDSARCLHHVQLSARALS